MSAEQELEDLVQFVYQCPVGLVEIDETGWVSKINPAAARMLAPAMRGGDMSDLFGVLQGLSPELVDRINADPTALGPIRTRRRVLVRAGPERPDYVELMAVRVDTGRVMVVLVDVSEERRLAQREHELAVSLQRSVLGRIDPTEDLLVSVTYRAAEAEQLVGGDWYDLITLPSGRSGLVIGDVVGHSIEATAVMGQLRNAIRGMAPWCEDPGELLARVDGLAAGIDGAACTTLTYAVLDPVTGRLTHASAGHPPPLHVRADGPVRFAMAGRSLPLACGAVGRRPTSSLDLRAGDALVLYTDGLVERRGEPISAGLSRLRIAAGGLARYPPGVRSEILADELLLDGPPQDDVCIMTITVPEPRGRAAPASSPTSESSRAARCSR